MRWKKARRTSVDTGSSGVLAAAWLLDLDLFARNSATIDVAAKQARSGIKRRGLDHAHGAVSESANDLDEFFLMSGVSPEQGQPVCRSPPLFQLGRRA
jgi:hypothetical protein